MAFGTVSAMENTPETWLAEAFASCQPTLIDDADWERLRPGFVAAFEPLGYEPDKWHNLQPNLSCALHLMADVLAAEPDATVADALQPHRVQGYLERLIAEGAAEGTIANRRGALNALLRGRRRREGTGAARGDGEIRPYSQREAAEIFEALPEGMWQADVVRELLRAALEDREARCTAAQAKTARVWFSDQPHSPGVDRRRLKVTRVVTAIDTRSALDVARRTAVGRRRINAAFHACVPPSDQEMKEQLRGPA